MKALIARFEGLVKGVLSGFDRIVFKGRILPVLRAEGAEAFCRTNRILNKDYKSWMTAQSEAIVEAADRYCRQTTGCGITPLATYRVDKEQTARERQQNTGIEKDLIGVWSCQESGASFRSAFVPGGSPRLRHYEPHCKHLYFYFDHADFGFMNVRLQTWFPYDIQICMNGRHRLARSLRKSGVPFVMAGNKLIDVADFGKAQDLLTEQLQTPWLTVLDDFLPAVFPTFRQTLGDHLSYYWTCWQSEWATDLVFPTPEAIDPFIDDLIRHALTTGTGTRILTYLCQPVTRAGQPYANSHHHVHSSLLEFRDGARVRHWDGPNSVKCYTELNTLRLETTINDPRVFKGRRRAQHEPDTAPKKLRPLRKGVADVGLRALASDEVNTRFANQLASFSQTTPLRDLLDPLTRPRTRNGRSVRALDPTGKDRELLQAIASPEWGITGISNALLRAKLTGTAWAKGKEGKQLAARITRHIRLLRDHGIIHKAPNQRRYHLSKKGDELTTAINVVLNASTQELMKLAA